MRRTHQQLVYSCSGKTSTQTNATMTESPLIFKWHFFFYICDKQVKKAVSSGSFLALDESVPMSSSETAVTKRALPSRWVPLSRPLYLFISIRFFPLFFSLFGAIPLILYAFLYLLTTTLTSVPPVSLSDRENRQSASRDGHYNEITTNKGNE